MPQAIPFAVAFAASNTAAALGASVATQATIAAGAATVAASIQTTALLLGASYLVAKLTAPGTPSPAEGQVELKQPVPSRFYTYGNCKVSGPVLLLEVGTGHALHKATAFGTRPVSAMSKFYVDGNDITHLITTTSVANVFRIDYWFADGSHGYIKLHLGDNNQAADTTIISDWSEGWTTNHRLRGIPYAIARLDSGSATNFQEAFPNGEPSFSCVCGVNVYDPRLDSTNGGSGSHRMTDPTTWTFSENQRLCCLDWLTWKEGYAHDWDRIDWASWVPQINLADQNVALKAGGTEKRYRLATRVGLDEPKGRVLRRILDAGDQQLYYTSDGLIGSRGGQYVAPSVSLEVETFPEGAFTHGIPMMDRVNEFELKCMMPSREYSEVELNPWVKAGDTEHAAGIIRRVPLSFTQVPSHAQAQRLAKIAMAKSTPRWSGQVRTNFAGLNALGEQAVNLSFAELDVPANSFDGPFWINGTIAFTADKTGITFPVASLDPAAYSWTAATDERDPPPEPEYTQDPETAP